MILIVLIYAIISRDFSNGQTISHNEKFWSKAICTNQIIHLNVYGLYQNYCNLQYGAFGTIVSLLEEKGDNALLLKTHYVDNSSSCLESSEEYVFPKIPMNYLKRELEEIDNQHKSAELSTTPWKLNVILTNRKNFVNDTIDNNLFPEWTEEDYFFVLITDYEECVYEDQLLSTILTTFWDKMRALNVFAACITSNQVYFFNPFKARNTDQRDGISSVMVRSSDNLPNIFWKLSAGRLKNLYGYPLKINIFKGRLFTFELPANKVLARKLESWNGLYGRDISAMKTLTNSLNATIHLIPLETDEKYVEPIVMASTRQVDISFKTLFIRLPPNGTVTWTTAFMVECIFVMVPRPKIMPKWLQPLYGFHWIVWMFIALSILIVSLCWYLLQKWITRRETHSVSEIEERTTDWIIVSTLLLVIGSSYPTLKSRFERVFFSGVLLASITIMGAFAGTLYKSLTTTLHYPPINTLEQLADSGLPIFAYTVLWRDAFNDSVNGKQSDVMRKLLERYTFVQTRDPDVDFLPFVLSYKGGHSAAALSTKQTFLQRFTYILDYMTIIPGCVRSAPAAFVLPRKSIYNEKFHNIIMHFNQAGLFNFWYESTKDFATDISKRAVGNKKIATPFRVHDLQIAFVLLIIGIIPAIIIFFGEMGWTSRAFSTFIELSNNQYSYPNRSNS